MNPAGLMETLARSTEIIGRMLEAISDGGALSKQAAWVTNAGRAFWGVVEISAPRSVGKLLGQYWQSLLFLISAILIVAGLISGQAGVSEAGWTCLAIAAALGSFMRGGSVTRFLRGLAILIFCGIFVNSGFTIYKSVQDRWASVQKFVCGYTHMCSAEIKAELNK